MCQLINYFLLIFVCLFRVDFPQLNSRPDTLFFCWQEIAELSSNIASIHLDALFDYGSKLQDEQAGALVEKYYKGLDTLTKVLLDANDERVRQGFLPYPYFLPEYVTNSVSTWSREIPSRDHLWTFISY